MRIGRLVCAFCPFCATCAELPAISLASTVYFLCVVKVTSATIPSTPRKIAAKSARRRTRVPTNTCQTAAGSNSGAWRWTAVASGMVPPLRRWGSYIGILSYSPTMRPRMPSKPIVVELIWRASGT